MDFFENSAEYFDAYIYMNFLESLRCPQVPEEQLCSLHPSRRTVNISISDLIEAGALVCKEGSDTHAFRLAEEIVDAGDRFLIFGSAWNDERNRLWLAALIGDWPAADAIAHSNHQLAAITGPRAKHCRELRFGRLRNALDRSIYSADALRAMADLRDPDLDNFLSAILRSDRSQLILAALEIIAQLGDPRWCLEIFELFKRLSPRHVVPAPPNWMRCLKFLIQHGFRHSETIPRLVDAQRTDIPEAVWLALEFAPQLALPLVRRGLACEVPMCRIEVAAGLALINAPWSRQELLRILSESDSQEVTAEVRAALLETGDESAEKAVHAWQHRYPHHIEEKFCEGDDGVRYPVYSADEVLLMNKGAFVQYEMEGLLARIDRIRHVVPPEPEIK
ncbi:MAG: hypothetical protein DCC68_10250 [Planctomycetota bacterium]|nr:MAG: hypothetical protein DCC68_10250 [Planctomycetota bacterium]